MASILDYIGRRESNGDYTVSSKTSSAGGKYGFINSSWISVVRRARPDLANLSDKELLALKTSDSELGKTVQEQAADYFLKKEVIPNLEKNGIEPDQRSIYLSWFAGPAGAVKILKSDPNTPISEVMEEKAIKANADIKLGDKTFKDFTVADLQSWAGQNKGGGAVTGGVTGNEGEQNTNDVLEAATTSKSSPSYSNRDLALASSLLNDKPKEVAPLQIPNIFAAKMQQQQQQPSSQQTSPYGAIGEDVGYARGGIISVYGV